jgi:hypothetical protein
MAHPQAAGLILRFVDGGTAVGSPREMGQDRRRRFV